MRAQRLHAAKARRGFYDQNGFVAELRVSGKHTTHRIDDRNMTDNFEKKVAVDGPVVNAGELGSSTFSPGQALPAGPLGLGQRWTVARKREVVLRLLRDEPVQLLSRQLGVEIFRLEQWREKAIGGIDASLKQRKGDPVQAELDSAMKRIGELTMQVELLEAKTETFGPLGRRRSRR